MWLELVVVSNRIAWTDGRLVEPLAPFPLERPLRFGLAGTGVDVEWSRELVTVTPTVAGATFAWRRGEVECPAGSLWPRGLQDGPPTFRLLAARGESAGWPPEVTRPTGPWNDATLDVLADQLLEAGHAVGRRLLRQSDGPSEAWLPLLDSLDEGRVAVTWRRGVVDTLRVRPSATWSFGNALARHAVCAPLRRLVLGPGVADADAARLVMGLISGGGLPCLEALTVQRPHELGRGAPAGDAKLRRQLRALAGFDRAFPALQAVVTETSAEPIRL